MRVFTVSHLWFSSDGRDTRDRLLICTTRDDAPHAEEAVKARFLRLFQDVAPEEVYVSEGLDLWAAEFQKIAPDTQKVLFDIAKNDGAGYEGFEYVMSLSYNVKRED